VLSGDPQKLPRGLPAPFEQRRVPQWHIEEELETAESRFQTAACRETHSKCLLTYGTDECNTSEEKRCYTQNRTERWSRRAERWSRSSKKMSVGAKIDLITLGKCWAQAREVKGIGVPGEAVRSLASCASIHIAEPSKPHKGRQDTYRMESNERISSGVKPGA
jgi:hypothetical protein